MIVYRKLGISLLLLCTSILFFTHALETTSHYEGLRTTASLKLEAPTHIPWNKLEWGDIVLGKGCNKRNIPYGYFQHAGLWHPELGKVISAIPRKGVCLEDCSTWTKDYGVLEFLTVRELSIEAKKALTLYAHKQLGKPYKLSRKNTATSWYCSKIPWASYKGKGVNLDPHRTLVVTPDSLYRSKHTQTIYRKGPTPTC